MTDRLLTSIFSLPPEGSLKACLRINDEDSDQATITNIGEGQYKLSVHPHGGRVYGPGAPFGTKVFVKAPVIGRGQPIDIDLFKEPFIDLTE